MNNSKRTRDIARGIYLWACVQDMPLNATESIEHKAWNDWAQKHTQQAIDFVQNEQYRLFDDCLAIKWHR